MNHVQRECPKLPYVAPRITEKALLKIDIQTNSVADGGAHS